MAQIIHLEQLEIFAHHGVFKEEKEFGQDFYVTCDLTLDGTTKDELDTTVDYGELAHFIQKTMQEKSFQLIECAAEHLAREILLHDPKIRKLDLELQKPNAPIGLIFETVAIRISRSWHTVYLSMGSNIGDREGTLRAALAELDRREDCRLEKVSSLIETEPYGGVVQDKFMNGAAKLMTLMTPHELLECFKSLEKQFGRETTVRWGPRTLDLDILFYDDLVMGDEVLCIPHVDLENRMFVLGPMCEIEPYLHHPVLGKPLLTLKKELEKTLK